MILRTTAAVLAALTFGGSSLLLAAGDAHPHDDWHRQHREVAREIRQAVRDAMRSVRTDTRPLVRDIVREVTREMHAATAWTWSDRPGQDDREARQRAAAERRRENAERRAQRESQREAQRSERDRERDARAFRAISPTDDACAEQRGGDRGHACEVRDSRLPAPINPLTVTAPRNGGIRVQAWDQADVLVQAVVHTYGDTDAEARAVLPEVRVTAAGTQVTAEGPDSDGRSHRGWSVSFRIWAPRQTALALTANNGGVSLHGMTGESRFSTTNGGVALDGVGGHVVGSTRNGGVNVRLDGGRWNGDGLEIETSNGGVSLAVPEGYSAELDTSTVNGSVRSDYPVTVQGRIDRQLRTTLGSGGPRLKITTVNGGVRITRR